MIDASKLPRVPNEVLQKEKQRPEYARAPEAPGAPVGAGRPPAIQETTR